MSTSCVLLEKAGFYVELELSASLESFLFYINFYLKCFLKVAKSCCDFFNKCLEIKISGYSVMEYFYSHS